MTTQPEPDATETVAIETPAARAKPAVSRARKTRQLEAVTPADVSPADMSPADATARTAAPTSPDETATVQAPIVRGQPPILPRKSTLAVAIPKHMLQESNPRPTPTAHAHDDGLDDGIADEVDEDEWAIADQPTIYLSPRHATSGTPDAWAEWPQRPDATPRPMPTARPPVARPQNPARPYDPERPPAGRRPMPMPPAPPRPRGAPPSPSAGPSGPRGYSGARLASPDGRPMPAGSPPGGVPRAALPNPRMERFQRLHSQRIARADGAPNADGHKPVAELVRQWWNDLLPGLRTGLAHQHEARASGVRPIPAYESAPTSRLGDVFGRVAATARGITERSRAVAAPKLKRLHNQAEQAAHALVGRIEGSTVAQQAPFLGPGRIAIFFRNGVSVGQAHALLVKRQARPMRLIPRKHGFLAHVTPGQEIEIAEGLRDHPYVRDVAYIEYLEDEYTASAARGDGDGDDVYEEYEAYDGEHGDPRNDR